MKFIIQALITSRPLGWLIFIISYLAGVILSGKYFTLQQLITLILIGPLLSFVIYVYNDIYDYDSDVVNDRKQLAIMGGVLKKNYWRQFKLLANLFLAIIVIVPIIFSNWLGLICILFGLLIGIGYSVPPLRFKTRFGGDILACCCGFLALFVLGTSENLAQAYSSYSVKYALYTTLMVAVWSLLFLSIDYQADKKASHETTVHKFTQNQAIILSAFGYLVCSILIVYLFSQLILALILLVCAVFTGLALKYKSNKYNIFLAFLITFLSAIANVSLYLALVIK